MKLKYVGCKQFEDAFKSETGVTWAPGVSHEIEDASLSERMLKHPDVFALDGKAMAKAPAPSPEPIPDPKPDPVADQEPEQPKAEDQPKAEYIMKTDGGPLVLDTLDKDTLRKLIDEAGLKVHHKAGEDKMRTALVEAFPVTKAE